MSRIKVRFNCPAEYKSQFAISRCLVSISVGQAKHEGEKFKATLEKVDQCFSHCTIMVADTLQRFNFKMFHPHLSSNQARQMAYHAGDEWLMRNKEAIANLSIPYEIIRWDEWLAHSKFKLCKLLIDELYENNEAFRRSLHQAGSEFLLRLSAQGKILNQIEAYKQSLEFIKEECAVQVLMVKRQFDFELYPSLRLLPVDFMHRLILKEKQQPQNMCLVGIEIKTVKPKNLVAAS